MAVVEVPGSKSITNRALFLAACGDGASVLHAPLQSDDTEAFALGLAALGYRVGRTPEAWTVHGEPAADAAFLPEGEFQRPLAFRGVRSRWALPDVLGGLLAFGIIGLFVGPVVLAVTYRLLERWVAEADDAPH